MSFGLVPLQLIQMAVRNGDTHRHTMEMADYWLLVRLKALTNIPTAL